MVGTPDALKGACPVWGGLGGDEQLKAAPRRHSTPWFIGSLQADTYAREE
jgi:hypothetical protein